MKKWILCILLLLLPFAMTGCAEEDAPGDTRVGERSEEMPEYCSILDGKLRVLLDANVTTGYEWTFFIDDTDVLVCDKEQYVPDGAEEGVCGAGGKYVADFSPMKDGQATLKLTYGRPWENCFAKRMFVDVTVEGGVITSVTENTEWE